MKMKNNSFAYYSLRVDTKFVKNGPGYKSIDSLLMLGQSELSR